MKDKLNSVLLLIIAITLGACSKNQKPSSAHIIKSEFQTLIETVNVEGSILIYDFNKNNYYSNDFEWAETARLPASTFKIPNSIIALELGVVENEETLFKWDGQDRYFDVWEQDLTLKQAFHYSCVPCYQDIARKIGTDRMNQTLDKFSFGEMLVDESTIDDFWLVGDSKISQFQQIDFLKRFYLSELPISKLTLDIMKEMMVVKETKNYTISAKTGLSVNVGKYNGWYVGYVESKENVFFFATNISPLSEYDKSFNNFRKSITLNALAEFSISF